MKSVITEAIASLLQPFIQLDESRLRAISIYIDLLMRWNARMNLTAVRQPEEIVQRHFGESFFAAQYLLQAKAVATAMDIGSGAGFPGVPFALLAPDVRTTLIESNQKKSTFLRELIHALELKNVVVYTGRAETYPDKAELVIFRAVERFEKTLATAVDLTAHQGRVALMIGLSQADAAKGLVPNVEWQDSVLVPGTFSRVLLIGTRIVKVA